MKESKELDQYFVEHFGRRAIATDMAVSQKYRYVPEFETGGTFGVNMHEANERMMSFNYQSIHESDARRLEQHDTFILQHYLKQFNDEIIIPRSFDHCGEPCAITCKKYNGEFKKDYEPYQALGPNCGVFDQRAAERLNKYVDSLGLDSIQTGGMVSWIMELIAEKIIPAADFGLADQPHKFKFASKSEEFDVVADSAINADFAIAVIDMMLYSEAGAPFRQGLRSATKWLDAKYGIRSIDRAVYTAHGENGCMVINQYWVPGMLAPMPIMGKYFSYYNGDFVSPYELGRRNVERFVYELYSENSGACRFHRKWVEDIIGEIISSHFDLDLDLWTNNFRLAKQIHDYQSQQSQMWEGKRSLELVQGFLEMWQRQGLKNPELETWVEKFKVDAWQAGREFWHAMYQGMCDAFEHGLDEPSHSEHGFIKK